MVCLCSFLLHCFQWFKGGITNICYNCLDRNVEAGLGDKIALYWEGNEPGVDGTLTYTQLLHQVCQVSSEFSLSSLLVSFSYKEGFQTEISRVSVLECFVFLDGKTLMEIGRMIGYVYFFPGCKLPERYWCKKG